MIMAGASPTSLASATALVASSVSGVPAPSSLAASRASTARVKLMGAQRLSGHTHAVRSRHPSMSGRGTPHSTLPEMRNGTSALPERKRTPARLSTSWASSRSRQVGKTTVNEPLLPSASMTSWAGSSARTASNSSRNLTWMKRRGASSHSSMVFETTERTVGSAARRSACSRMYSV